MKSLSEDKRELYTRVLDEMLKAKWLQKYAITDDGCTQLMWLLDGNLKAMAMADMLDTYPLLDPQYENVITVFNILAHGEPIPAGLKAPKLDEWEAKLWRTCVAELGIRGDEEAIRAMLEIFQKWAPTEETNITCNKIEE